MSSWKKSFEKSFEKAKEASAKKKATAFTEKLKAETVGCRLKTSKFGARKALTRTQTKQAAAAFSAQGEFLSASKKLLDTSNPAYREVTAVIAQAKAYWKAMTFPYPEKGIRLLKRERVDKFADDMAALVATLELKVETLSEQYDQIRDAAREKLGELFDERDYPSMIDAEFDLGWEFPNLAAPEFLKTMNPVLYEAEKAKLESQFNEAVKLTELALADELNTLVSGLLDKLTPDGDGKPKTFKAATVTNLNEFFSRFTEMDLGSSDELRELVEQAQQAVNGVDPNSIRKDQALRDALSGKLKAVGEQLEKSLVAKPKRAIVFEDEPATESTSTGTEGDGQ